MMRSVVLEHRLPDGSRHFDWMIERPDPGVERRLWTWRTEARPDRVEAFAGEQIGNHRVVYLEFEGELSGGRGRVTRVAAGQAIWLGADSGKIGVRIVWSDGPNVRYNAEIGVNGVWSFRGSRE